MHYLLLRITTLVGHTIQQCIDREYENLFYMSKDLQVVDVHRQVLIIKLIELKNNLLPGFT